MITARLEVSTIRLDCGTQSRANIKQDAVSEYSVLMTTGVEFPPIDVFHDGNHYYLAHGFHRCLAAIRANIKEFPCVVHGGTLQDALWFSLGTNISNGERRDGADKRRAVELALSKFPDKTQQEVADHVGCARSYVAKVGGELVTSDKFTLPATRKGKDGKSRPTKYKTQEAEPTPIPLKIDGEIRAQYYDDGLAIPNERPRVQSADEESEQPKFDCAASVKRIYAASLLLAADELMRVEAFIKSIRAVSATKTTQ